MDLVDAVKKCVNPTPSITVQRFKINSRSRHPGETVSIYVLELCSIAEFCNFGQSLEDMLRDCVVCGINDDAESRLTLKRALEIAQSLETAAHNKQALQGTLQMSIAGTVTQPKVFKVSSHNAFFRCGKTSHSSAKCKFKCYHCGKVGHIQVACCGKNKPDQPVRKRAVHCLHNVTDSEIMKEYSLFNLSTTMCPHPYTVTVNVDGQDLPMEIDTGTSVSLLSDDTRKLLWPNK